MPRTSAFLTRWPIRSTAADTRASVRPFTMTFAPSAASAAAMANPMPAVEPDTTAVLPLSPRFILYRPRISGFLPGSSKGRCAFDFGDFIACELQFSGAHDAFGLPGVAGAYDGSGDGGVAQGPGDGDFTGGAAVAGADLTKAFDEFQIFRQARVAEFRIAAAKIIGRQGGGAFACHGSGEQAGGHGCVRDHPYSLFLAIGESLGFDLAADDGVGRLQGGDWGDFFGALDLRCAEIRNADPADFAFGFQCGESLPGFLDAGFAVIRRPVHLIEIDRVDVQAAKTVFAFAPNGIRAEFLPNFALLVPTQNAFGENVGTRATPFLQRARDDLFRVAYAVDGGRVDPIDTQFQRAMNGGDGIGVVLWSPSKFPAGTTESPSAKADGGNFNIGIS